MKKVLFIMTHLESGWEALVDALKQDSRFDFFETDCGFHHPDDLYNLTDQIHRRDNSAAIWSTAIFHNKDFTCRALAKCCKFVYWSTPLPEGVLERYYDYRLSGMRVWHRRTDGLWNPSLESDSLLGSVLG
jgi:hypothetical protein